MNGEVFRSLLDGPRGDVKVWGKLIGAKPRLLQQSWQGTDGNSLHEQYGSFSSGHEEGTSALDRLIPQLLQYSLCRLPQAGHLGLDHIPDDIEVQPKVPMRDHIPEPGCLRPVRLGHQGPGLWGEMLRSLADDLQVPDHRIDHHVVRPKRLEGNALGVAADFPAALQMSSR